MHFKSRFVRVALIISVAAALALAAARAGESLVPSLQKLSNSELVVYSDATPTNTANTAVRYSAFLHASRAFLGPETPPFPMTIMLLLRTPEELGRFTTPADVAGVVRQDWMLRMLDRHALVGLQTQTDVRTALPNIYGLEGSNHFWRLGYEAPAWLRCGLAVVLSSLEFDNDQISFPTSNYRSRLPKDWLDLDALMKANPNIPSQADPKSLNPVQLQCWALVHWLLLDEDRPVGTRFQTVRKLLLERSPVDRLLQTDALGELASLKSRVQKHLGQKPKPIPYDARTAQASFKLQPAPDAETCLVVAEFMASQNRIDEALLFVRAVQDKVSDQPSVEEALGRIEDVRGQRVAAAEHYRRAISLGTANSYTYAKSAEVYLGERGVTRFDFTQMVRMLPKLTFGDRGDSTLPAIADFRAAIKLEPSMHYYYEGLGRAFFLTQKVDPSMAAELEPGIDRSNIGTLVHFYHAALLWRLQRREEATTELEWLAQHPDVNPELARFFQSWLEVRVYEIGREKISRLIDNRRYEEADAEISALAPNAPKSAQADLAQLRTAVAEGNALQNLHHLYDDQNWAALSTATDEFLKNFPRSLNRMAVQNMAKQAQQRLTP